VFVTDTVYSHSVYSTAALQNQTLLFQFSLFPRTPTEFHKNA